MDQQLKAEIAILLPTALVPLIPILLVTPSKFILIGLSTGRKLESRSCPVLIPEFQVYNLFNHLFSLPEMLLPP